MKKSAFISDLVFAFFLASIFSLCLFRYWRFRMPIALLLACLCGGLTALGVGLLSQNKRKRLRLQTLEEGRKNKLLTHLSLLSDGQKSRFFQTVLAQTDKVRPTSALRLIGDEAVYLLKIRFSPVTADEVATISRIKSAKEKILLCNRIDEDAKTLCDTLRVRVWTGNEIYELVKRADALPESYLGEPTAQNKRKLRLRLCFAKRNARRFFVGGALLLLTSLITPFPYYYLVFGSILLFIAAGIRIFGYAD